MKRDKRVSDLKLHARRQVNPLDPHAEVPRAVLAAEVNQTPSIGTWLDSTVLAGKARIRNVDVADRLPPNDQRLLQFAPAKLTTTIAYGEKGHSAQRHSGRLSLIGIWTLER